MQIARFFFFRGLLSVVFSRCPVFSFALYVPLRLAISFIHPVAIYLFRRNETPNSQIPSYIRSR
jgi:hypothetical protein